MGDGPWLVTGASGFLGRHLLQQLQRRSPGRSLLVLVRSREEWDAMEWTGALRGVDLVTGGVTAPERWAADPRLTGLAGIFHLAARVRHDRQDSAETYFVNLEGSKAMVRLAGRYRCRIVLLSTSGTVGCFRDPDQSADEDAPYCESVVGQWPYYDSKIKAERAGRELAAGLPADLVIVRPPVLLGPLDHRFRSSAHVARLLNGKLPFLIRGGMHFADVRDVAAALVAIMERETVRPVYHLPGTASTIEDFYRMVAEVAGVPAPRRVIGYRPALWLSKLSHGLGLHLLPAPLLVEMAAHYWGMHSKYAEAELGYRSRDPRETLRDTVDWLRTGATG
jgi:dihydroflavonol-4-reductase